jgi:sec-independent protein translocase protein TatB
MMLDVSFWEITMILLVALLVFGPEKLPEAARTAGKWVGRIRRLIQTVQQDIDRELRLQEIKETIKQSEQTELYEFLRDTKNELEDLKRPFTELKDSVNSELRELSTPVTPAEILPSPTPTSLTPLQPTESR